MPALTQRENIAATREVLTELFGSQMESARRLHFHERTVRFWCQHGAPPHVLNALWRLKDQEISLPWARQLMRTKRTRRSLNGKRA